MQDSERGAMLRQLLRNPQSFRVGEVAAGTDPRRFAGHEMVDPSSSARARHALECRGSERHSARLDFPAADFFPHDAADRVQDEVDASPHPRPAPVNQRADAARSPPRHRSGPAPLQDLVRGWPVLAPVLEVHIGAGNVERCVERPEAAFRPSISLQAFIASSWDLQ